MESQLTPSTQDVFGPTLSEEPRPGASRKLSGQEEAILVATACAKPKGRARWTLTLLAGDMVRLTEDEGLARETVGRRLAENELKLPKRPTPSVRWFVSTKARRS